MVFKWLKQTQGMIDEMKTIFPPQFDLTGQVVIFTGALGLIGSEGCDALAEAGAHVVMLDIAPEEECKAAADALSSKYSRRCIGLRVDITQKEQLEQMVSTTIEEFGKIDCLINCAGIDAKFDAGEDKVFSGAFADFPLDAWQKSFDVNATGLFLATQVVVPHMVKRRYGNIINIASTYSLVAPDQSLYFSDSTRSSVKPVDYIASKSFIPNFTRYLASYFGQNGIRANTLVPHGVDNEHDDSFRRRFIDRSPLRRMCNVSELRGPFVFLASSASSYMTGGTLVIDGGWTCW